MRAIDDVQNEIGGLAKNLAELEARLGPILVADLPPPIVTDDPSAEIKDTTATTAECELASRIAGSIPELRALSNMVARITRRVDV